MDLLKNMHNHSHLPIIAIYKGFSMSFTQGFFHGCLIYNQMVNTHLKMIYLLKMADFL